MILAILRNGSGAQGFSTDIIHAKPYKQDRHKL